MNIVNLGYKATNYYLLQSPKAQLLLDGGWPGTMPEFLATLKRKGVEVSQITHLLATHYHPDHAGLAQNLKLQGVKLIVMESQRAAIPALRSLTKPEQQFLEITLGNNIDLTFGQSRAFLQGIGIAGQVVPTPGHSDDSVTLALDDGAVFTGDLPGPTFGPDEISETVHASWQLLRSLNATTIYPGHGPVRPLR